MFMLSMFYFLLKNMLLSKGRYLLKITDNTSECQKNIHLIFCDEKQWNGS